VKLPAPSNIPTVIENDDGESEDGDEEGNEEEGLGPKGDKTVAVGDEGSGYDTTDSLSDLDEILRAGGGANKKPTATQEQDSANSGHKVKATANQNYRRLKIRGKATKANSRSKFSKKRR